MNQPVYLAIPNYNMGKQLQKLLPKVLGEDFTHIYVLDDASTDNSVAIVRRFASTDRVSLIEGMRNQGAGVNRNRMLGSIKDGILVFLDADMELVSSGIVPKIRQAFSSNEIGIVGFEIVEQDNQPMCWNFGARKTPRSDLVLFRKIRKEKDLEFVKKLYAKNDLQILGYNPLRKPMRRQEVYWVAEGFFAIRTELFSRTAGFDEAIRYHEIHTLAHKSYRAGFNVFFDPCVTARHLKIQVRGKMRRLQKLHAAAYIYLKYSR